MDYRKKYLECFFMWQDIYEKACQRIRELEKELAELRKKQ